MPAFLYGIRLDVVYDEAPEDSVETNRHPVEEGIDVIDHIKKNPAKITLSGVINAKDHRRRERMLRDRMHKGFTGGYNGRIRLHNMVMTKFVPRYTNAIVNGFEFTINLEERATVSRIVKETSGDTQKRTSTISSKGVQQTSSEVEIKPTYHTVVSGDTFWGLSRQYGSTVAWLEKVNKKYSANSLPIGAKVRVK
ncbi:LysM peptidoglycan-binding domain-containing protein [Metabacillus litoralis]|uniref:LysM peptidoglycan-binding domain-containing protein n=1 Tax=Metabacillus litoralis TaxID=152268 RepID=UPI00203D3F8E|nr:LysM peptidoglycan-binding domain-containing protein [Metabacillus litoralis]MCM3413518.1 LysM peptidoglycan-binding domain-containing protein [Metabacillus litoralis]